MVLNPRFSYSCWRLKVPIHLLYFIHFIDFHFISFICFVQFYSFSWYDHLFHSVWSVLYNLGFRSELWVWCGVVWCGVVWCGMVWCGKGVGDWDLVNNQYWVFGGKHCLVCGKTWILETFLSGWENVNTWNCLVYGKT